MLRPTVVLVLVRLLPPRLLQIPDAKLRSFVLSVKDSYKDKPFHNLTHAVSVAHGVFSIIKSTRVDSVLRPLDKLALLTSALCHDIDHPG